MTEADRTRKAAAVRHAPRKLASGPSCRAVPTSSRRRSRLRTSTGLFCGRRRALTSNAVVARYYDPQTAQFLSRDPLESITHSPYGYVDGDPLDGSDPTGLDHCIPFTNICVGFHPGDAINSIVNIGRGMSFGLSDKIANWISPGASCTVDQNAGYQALGAAATLIATFGTGGAAGDGASGASDGIPGLKPGWQGRTADSGKGWLWQEPGASGNANSMRVMDPTPAYPNGYVRFYNDQGQPIDLNGKPTSPAETHIPRRAPGGGWQIPSGW